MDWFCRRKRAWRAELHSNLLAYYCDLIEKERGQKWRIQIWSQEVRVSENGDVDQKLCFTAVAECDRLDFVSFTEPRRLRRRSA